MEKKLENFKEIRKMRQIFSQKPVKLYLKPTRILLINYKNFFKIFQQFLKFQLNFS